MTPLRQRMLQDMQMRLTRLELCVRSIVPDYDMRTAMQVQVLTEAAS